MATPPWGDNGHMEDEMKTLTDVMSLLLKHLGLLDARHTPTVSTIALSEALTAGTAIEVLEHTVGGDGMTVFLCGVLCERGEDAQYLDVDSTHISFNDDLEAGMDITVVVSFK